jgi:hypothetical protein
LPYCAVAPASAGKPHLLKLVEVAHFRAEDVDDHVARVDQNPVAGILAFDLAGHAMALLEPFHQFLRDRRDLPGGAARGHDHPVGNGRFSAQIDLHDILGLVVFERSNDTRQQLIAGEGVDPRRGLRHGGPMGPPPVAVRSGRCPPWLRAVIGPTLGVIRI